MSGMEVLVVGSGGREHVLGELLNNSDEVVRVHFANGNPGTAELSKGENHSYLKPGNVEGIVRFIEERDIGLTIVGPEAPLVEGLTDQLRANGRLVFGPSQAATMQTEGSKVNAYRLNEDIGNDQPYADIYMPKEDYRAQSSILNRDPKSFVIKADGLAGGKGVVVPDTSKEALKAISGLFHMDPDTRELDGWFNNAAENGLLIQDRHHGPEVSAFVVSDGENFTILPFSQDHKRIGEGDTGLNTGGMGAYSPLPESIVNERQARQIEEMARRVIEGLAKKGMPYQGVLYMGLMLSEENNGNPVVIEYNSRFGDPEAQVVLPLLQHAGVDMFELMRSAAEGRLADIKIPANLGKSALTVCLAAEHYPESPRKGDVIKGLDRLYSNVSIYHGGTKREGDVICTAGGRVLYVTGYGDTIDEAAIYAYEAIGPNAINWPGMQYRGDIAYQARNKQAA